MREAIDIGSLCNQCSDIGQRPRESSRLICRSVSPANGNLIKETLPVAPRSLEKPSRVAGTRPPRAHRDWRALVPVPTTAEDPPNPVPRKNSNQGMTVNELVAKQEKEHYMTVMQAEKTAIGVQQLTASLQKGGVSAMLKDALFADELVVTQMLRMLNDTKRWDVNMCDIYLPKLKEFLQDSSLPEPCRQVALASLQSIATGLIDSLRNCARAPLSSIGVDVAAEERKKKAENCIKELRELRDKREQFYRKLTQEEVYRLDAIMVFLKPL
ncbi:unnamed protein product [Heligmosomoides polygyrus]|uniref:Katanin_con80 domain-containing protein n=1 Tax=Heligmosomoides polygyrus TaxID=6339 RepID=A0A183G6L7_HELPZ|nr:unnamed protein product [Heligmosomoides polygyrus]